MCYKNGYSVDWWCSRQTTSVSSSFLLLMTPLSFKTYQNLKFFKPSPSSQGKLRPLGNTNNKTMVCPFLHLHVHFVWYFKYFIFTLTVYYDCSITPVAFTHICPHVYHILCFSFLFVSPSAIIFFVLGVHSSLFLSWRSAEGKLDFCISEETLFHFIFVRCFNAP